MGNTHLSRASSFSRAQHYTYSGCSQTSSAGQQSMQSTPTRMSPEVRAMHIAVMKNDTHMLQHLVYLGVDVDEPWVNADNPSIKDGSTPLGEAVSLNHLPVIRILLAAGACPRKRDKLGVTPLHKAAYHGRKSLVPILVHAGAEIDDEDNDGNTALHICVKSGITHCKDYTDTAKRLIDAGACVNKPNNDGRIPLHFAVYWGLPDLVRVLLKAGSSMNYLDLGRDTPLSHAVKQCEHTGHERVVRVFAAILPAVEVMLYRGCDNLNLALWLRNQRLVERLLATCSPGTCDTFWRWYRASIPVDLKHLCRVFIQRQVTYHRDFERQVCYLPDLEQGVKRLPVPKVVQEYLARRPLCHNIAPNY